MTTSRRPNHRASSENPPGPRRSTAAAITTRKIAAGAPQSTLGTDGGSQENARLTLMSFARKPATGVRQPISKEAPVPRISGPTIHAPLPEFPPVSPGDRWFEFLDPSVEAFSVMSSSTSSFVGDFSAPSPTEHHRDLRQGGPRRVTHGGAALAGKTPMSPLCQAFEEYLTVRRALGFKLREAGST